MTTMQATWRKTRDGQWVVQGPAELVVPGRTVDVAKRDGGCSRVTIELVGKAFDRDGVKYRYGYTGHTGQRASGSGGSYGTCDECGTTAPLRPATDSSGIPGAVCARCYGPSYTLSFA